MAAALRLMYNPVTGPDELKDMNNVALVMIEARIPAHGARRGQKVDCYVSAIGGAKSLRGGRLLLSPLGSQLIDDERVMGLASGGISTEDAQTPTTGRIAGGVVVMEDIVTLFVQNRKFRVLLDQAHASFQSAAEVARSINRDGEFENSGKLVARATAPGVVEVDIPPQYAQNPVQFVAQVLATPIEYPNSQARVVVNSKTGVIVVTGEVQISTVVISHKNLSVAIGTDPAAPQPTPEPSPGVGFVGVNDQTGRQSTQKLQDLLQALNQLKVPTTDVIDIIRELNRTGKLHAVLITE